MAKVDGSLRSLIQGVSQQPEETRLAGQCTEQINFSSNPVDGLTRRAPTQEIATLFSSASEAQFYDFALGNVNYIAAFTPGLVQVFNKDTGAAITVNELNSAFSYIDGASLAAVTSSDVTYIVNRNKVALMKAQTATYATGTGVLYVKGGQYGRSYIVRLNGPGGSIAVTYTTPNGSVATDILAIATDAIANSIQTALNANATFVANYNINRKDSHILITSKTGAAFSLDASDGEYSRDLFALVDSVQDAADLPQFAVQGLVAHVLGSNQAQADDWYAMFTTVSPGTSVGGGFGSPGYWTEVVAPAINYKMDSATMPHILTFDTGTGQFTFNLAGFTDRRAGNYLTNPDPSFIGLTIEHISFFQGRLVFLSGPNVIMSRTNKPFDFWKNSATVLADTDVIDIYSTAPGVKKMYRAVPFNRDLVIFSDKGQFIVFGRNTLTPLNSSLVLTTTFEANLAATPVAAGRNTFFAQNFGQFTGIREFYADGASDQNDARAITQQVLKYLKGSVTALTTSTNFDILLVATNADPKTIYVYEYIWVDQKKVQSSWSKWIFDMDVKYTSITQSVVTVVQKIGTRYILSKVDLDVQSDGAVTYQIKLDRKKTIASINTSVVAPYGAAKPADPTTVLFVQGAGCPNPGMIAYIQSYNSGTDTYTLKQDMLGGTVYAGVRFMSRWQPSNPTIRDGDGVTVGTGKLRVNHWILTFTNTGFFGSRVFSRYFDDIVQTFSGRTIGDPDTVIGEPAIVTGKQIIAFRNDIDNAHLEIYSDSHEPLTMTVLEWTGQYTKRGRRIAGTGGH